MKDSEIEEAGSIMTRFETPSKYDNNPSSENEVIDEEPYDMDLTDTDI